MSKLNREIMDLLKKHMKESVEKSVLRSVIRNLMSEMRMSGTTGEYHSRSQSEKKRSRGPVHGVNVSDIVRAKPTMKDWADLLLDELEDEIPQVNNIPDEKRDKVTDELASGTVTSLTKALGFWAPRRKDK